MGATESDGERPKIGINHLTVVPRNFKQDEDKGNEETNDADEESSSDDATENPSFSGRGI